MQNPAEAGNHARSCELGEQARLQPVYSLPFARSLFEKSYFMRCLL